jgi:hypothetical protein
MESHTAYSIILYLPHRGSLLLILPLPEGSTLTRVTTNDLEKMLCWILYQISPGTSPLPVDIQRLHSLRGSAMRRDLPSSLVVQGSPWSVYPKIVSQEQPRSILIPSITGGTGLLSPASNGKTVDVIFRNRVSNGPIDADDVARAEFAIPKDPHHSSFILRHLTPSP